MEQKLIKQKQFAGFINQAVVLKRNEYWVIEVKEESGEIIQLTLQRLMGAQEELRKFSKLDSAANVLKEMGFKKFVVIH